MFLDLLFYATYKKMKKSGEKSLLTLNSCAFLSLVLVINVLTILLILELTGLIQKPKIIDLKIGFLIYIVVTMVISISYLANSRYKKVLNHYSKREVNIERYSVGYYFFSVLLLVLGALIKAQVS